MIKYDLKKFKPEIINSLSDFENFIKHGWYTLIPVNKTVEHMAAPVGKLLKQALVSPFWLFSLSVIFINVSIQDPSNNKATVIDISGRPTLFVIYYNDFSSTSHATVIYQTPNYPEKSEGMVLRLCPEKLVMYHYEFLSGLKIYIFYVNNISLIV